LNRDSWKFSAPWGAGELLEDSLIFHLAFGPVSAKEQNQHITVDPIEKETAKAEDVEHDWNVLENDV